MFEHDIGDTVYFIFNDEQVHKAQVVSYSDRNFKYALINKHHRIVFKYHGAVFGDRKIAEGIIKERKKVEKRLIKLQEKENG